MRIIAVDKKIFWRIVKTKKWYKLQCFNGFWWSTVSKVNAEEYVDDEVESWIVDFEMIQVEEI